MGLQAPARRKSAWVKGSPFWRLCVSCSGAHTPPHLG